MNMTKTTSVALFGAIFALMGAAACGYALYINAKMGAELTVRAQAIADNNEKILSLKNLRETYDRSKEEREQLSAFALTEDEVGDFLTEVERLGQSKGVTITTSALKVEKKKDVPDQLSVEFVVEGKEEQVRAMIDLFEKLPYPSMLSTLSLALNEGTKTKATVKILITLVKYDR